MSKLYVYMKCVPLFALTCRRAACWRIKTQFLNDSIIRSCASAVSKLYVYMKCVLLFAITCRRAACWRIKTPFLNDSIISAFRVSKLYAYKYITHSLFNIKPVGVHYFYPRIYEIVYKTFFVIVLCIKFSKRA